MKNSLIATALLILPPVTLAEVAWSVDSGVGHTDNATLSATDEVSDTLTWIGGSVAFEQDSRRVKASLDAQGNYVRYMDDTYDDDLVGYATGSLTLGIVPEAFLWTFEDSFGQVTINQFQPATPDNRQNINTFSTGPDFVARFGRQSQLRFSGRYDETRYEDSDRIDDQRLQASIAFERHLSANTSWAIIAASTRVEYDAPGARAYDQPELYASWRSTGARQTLSIDLGANRVKGFDDTYTEPLVRIDWTRRVAPSWTMNVNAASEFRNTSDQFVHRTSEGTPAGGTAGVALTDAPAATYQAGLAFAFERPRTKFSISGGYTQLDYVIDNGLNEDSWFGTATLSRRFTPRVQGSLTYRARQVQYQSFDRNETEHTAEAGLDWRATRWLFVTAGYVYSDSDRVSFGDTYTSNLVYVSLSYRRGETGSFAQ